MKRVRTFAAVSMLIMSALLMGTFGCKAQVTPSPTPKPATPVSPAMTPAPAPVLSKPAGTLVVATSDFGNEVWLVTQTTNSIVPMASCYDFLYYLDGEGKILPGLAEKWEVSPDGLTYTFHLRKGIQFHDGWGELTADDVKYTYELGIKKGSLNSALPTWAEVMDKVEVVDPYTIGFRLKRFSLMFFSRAGRERTPLFPIQSKKYVEAVGIEQAGRKPIGTGPYKFVEHVFGDHITFEAVDNHWRKTPAFKTLIIKKVPEQASRVAMLRAGEADIIDLSLAFKAAVVQAGFKIQSSPGAISYFIALSQLLPTDPNFDAKYPWVGDARDPKSWERALKVRKALNLAVNRDEIVKTILVGEGQPQAVTLFPPGSVGYDPALKPYPYDPEEAKRLLVEAGYPNGFEITMKLFVVPGRADGPIIGEAVAMMWQKIGVKVKLEPVEWAAFRPAVVAHKTPGLAWPWGGLFYDEPVEGYRAGGYSTGVSLWFGAVTAELDKLIDKAESEPNYELRTKLERQLAQYVYDNYLTVAVAVTNSIYGLSNRVANWPIPNGQSFLTNWESITYGPGFKP